MATKKKKKSRKGKEPIGLRRYRLAKKRTKMGKLNPKRSRVKKPRGFRRKAYNMSRSGLIRHGASKGKALGPAWTKKRKKKKSKVGSIFKKKAPKYTTRSQGLFKPRAIYQKIGRRKKRTVGASTRLSSGGSFADVHNKWV